MRRSLGVSLAVVSILGALAAMPLLASSHIVVQPLTGRATFTDDVSIQLKAKLDGRATEVVNISDASRLQTAQFTVQPGAMFPWHTHPGAVIVNVVAGELVYVGSEDCIERTYSAGEAFVDRGHGHVHTAFNPGSVPTVLVATFVGIPADGPLSLPQPAPDDCVVTP